jgi:uncharacterized protein with PIN domain
LLYIAVPVEQYCDITQVNALPENEGILEGMDNIYMRKAQNRALNYSDCFYYTLTKTRGTSILFKRNDFTQTFD